MLVICITLFIGGHMETQIKAYYQTPQGVKFVTIFGYATKGVPSLEINGAGRLSRNIKEKVIFITRTRKLSIPLRRFVICVDLNEVSRQEEPYLKALEFPILLLYWYLSGLIPIRNLNDCLASGWLKANGEIFQLKTPLRFLKSYKEYFDPIEQKSLKLIGPAQNDNLNLCLIESSLLLEHIPNLKFKLDFQSEAQSYMESDSAIPLKSFIA